MERIKALGVTHIWYTGVLAHSTCTDYTAYNIPKDHPAIVKGKAGSPYAIKDYYDVDPDLADSVPERIDEFMSLIERTHNAGMNVLIDFVPNHVARSYQSLMKPPDIDDLGQHDQTEFAFLPSNNFYYLPQQTLKLGDGYNEYPAKVTGNDCFTTRPDVHDWYETIKLNYGIDYLHGGATHFSPVPDTWQKMLHILLYWVGKNVDGFRCDMAEMVPVQFWNWVIPQVKKRKDVLFVAETYNPSCYQDYLQTGHFDLLYDKVGTYELLRQRVCHQTSTHVLREHLQRIEPHSGRLLFFLENHDEQRIASDFFAGNAFAGIPALIFIATYRDHPLLIYNGQELGEKGMDDEGFSGLDGKTSIFDYWRMDSIRRWANGGLFDGGLLSDEQKRLRSLYQKILRLSNEEKALSKGSYYGLDDWNEDHPHYPSDHLMTYLRKYDNELILVCINFDNRPHQLRIKLPADAFDVLQIPDNTASVMKDLLTGEEQICALTCTCPFQVTVPQQFAQILKFHVPVT